jgi:hypothetical protein
MFKTAVCYLLLFAPAVVLAWFHHSLFPALLRGSQDIFGVEATLPEGFELLIRFGSCVYFAPLLILSACLLSVKFHSLRSALWMSLCGGLLVTFCIVYFSLLVTPILSHGLYVGNF